MEAGLAPLLYRAAEETIDRAPPAWRDALKGADLTARVVYAHVCDSVNEILDACAEEGVRVTLLKGISTGEQYYPDGCLRPMRDVDLLVDRCDQKWVESMMVDRGYVPMPNFVVRDVAPHGVPLFHPQRRVWVEIHTSLFPKGDRLVRTGLFGPSQIIGHTVASTFHGRPVHRLSPDFQLAYIASYWMRDLSNHAFHASFVVPMVDAVFLLNSGQELHWERLRELTGNDLASASLYILLAYLCDHDVAPSATAMVERLAAEQEVVGWPERRILQRLIESYLVDGRRFIGQFGKRHPMIGRTLLNSMLVSGSHIGKVLSLPWSFFFPPWIPERYSVGYQSERFHRLLRARA
jgi:hypothetical protein